MIEVLLVLHVFVTIALIGVVLIQRSEGGGLGLGGGQGMGNFMTGRGTANLLTRATAVLGTLFFALSLGLALLYHNNTSIGAAAILNGPRAPAPIAAARPRLAAAGSTTPPGPIRSPAPPHAAAPADAFTRSSRADRRPGRPGAEQPCPPAPGHSGQ